MAFYPLFLEAAERDCDAEERLRFAREAAIAQRDA